MTKIPDHFDPFDAANLRNDLSNLAPPREGAHVSGARYRRRWEGRPSRSAALAEARAAAAIARKIFELRSRAGLTQRELAKLVGTTASVTCRLEDDDYEGHSLAMLLRIAAALDQRVEIRFVPLRKPA